MIKNVLITYITYLINPAVGWGGVILILLGAGPHRSPEGGVETWSLYYIK